MSDKEVRIRITGDASDLLKKLEAIKDSLDDLGTDSSFKKAVNNMVDGLKDAEKEAEDLTDNFEDMGDAIRKVSRKNDVSDITDELEELNDELEEAADNTKEFNDQTSKIDTKQIDAYAKSVENNNKQLDDSSKKQEKLIEQSKELNDSIGETKTAKLDFGGTEKSYQDIIKKTDGLGTVATSTAVSSAIISKSMANAFDDVSTEIKDVIAELNKLDDDTPLEEKVKAFDKFANTLEKVRNEVDDLTEQEKKLKTQINEAKPDTSDIESRIDERKKDIEYMERLKEALEELKDATFYGDEYGILEEDQLGLDDLDRLVEQAEAEIEDIRDLIDQYSKARDEINDKLSRGEQLTSDESSMDYDAELDELRESLNRYEEEIERYEDLRRRFIKEIEDDFDVDLSEGIEWNAQDEGWLEELRRDLAGLQEELNNINSTPLKEVIDLQDKLAAVQEKLAKSRKALTEASDKEQQYTDTAQEQLDAYRDLENEILDIINNTEEHILVQKRLAESFEQTSRSMKQMFDGLKDGYRYGDFGEEITISDWLKDAKKDAKDYIDTLDLVDYKTLRKDMDYLTKSIDHKIDKTKELKAVNEAMDYQTRQDVNSIEAEAKALREFADNAGYALKHLKEFAGTDKEWQVIGNHNKLEDVLSPEKIREYNEAVNEYLQLVASTGQISKRFMDDSGKFDINKYIADYERFGKPVNQLTASFKALRQQTLEYLKTAEEVNEAEVEAAREAVKSAEMRAKWKKEVEEACEASLKRVKALKEEAEAERERLSVAEQGHTHTRLGVQMSEELAEAVNKCIRYNQQLEDIENQLAEARENSAKAAEKLAKAQEDLAMSEDPLRARADRIDHINKEAEALRKLGATVEDITRVDIEEFDKSLASRLDNTFKGLFESDVPETMQQLKEDLQAALAEFNNLEFGKGFDLLKDAGKGLAKGVFAAIPKQAKIATAAVAALTLGIKKLYEAGKQDFLAGLSNIGNKIQPIINMVQNLGQETVAAFEEITDSDMDLSSLMALGPNFEYQMTKVASIAGSTDKQLAELTKTAEYLGGVTQYTASDVGEAFQYMAMAGYDTEEMLSSINGVLSLSIASGTDLASTTDIVTDYMTALGMEANSTSEFVDKLAATVTSSNTTVELFGTSMKQVASQAGMLGVTMTDLSTAIGLQANAGVKGSKAGTALKNVLANLAAPTEKQAAALKQLGLSADEAGSYLKTTADGNVDLAGTIKTIIKATEGMTKAQKTALIVTAMGKVAAPGILAILNQGAEAWDELSATIENSTGKIQYWNEGMHLAGKSGQEAVALIENMKQVFAEVEDEALNAGISTEELSHAIAILGDDGKVSSNNVKDLINVIDSMNTATGDAKKKWIELGAETKNAHLLGFDYDGTVAKLAADTQGLTQAEKEELQTKLKGVKTYKEAKEIAKAYQQELNGEEGRQVNLLDVVERNSLATMSYVDKLGLLRDAYKQLGHQNFKDEMYNLGLGEELEEILEVVEMSDEEFEAYTNNLETVKGMAEQLAQAMDETTKSSLLNLASAIENVAIGAFNSLKPAIKGACDEINKFFDTWHNGDTNVFTWNGLESALHNISSKIQGEKGRVQQAVVDLFSGLDRFINGGSLTSLLDIGTSVITGICDGILEARDNGTLNDAINGAIKKICEWIEDNSDQVVEASKAIIDALKEGIETNSEGINDACDSLYDVLNTWVKGNEGVLGQLGATVGTALIKGVVKGFFMGVGNFFSEMNTWIGELGVAIVKGIGQLGQFLIEGGIDLVKNLAQGFVDGVVLIGDEIDKAVRSLIDKCIESLNPKNWSGGKRDDSGIKPEELIKLPTADEIVTYIKNFFKGVNPLQLAKNYLFGETYAAEVGGGGGKSTVKPEQLIKLPSIGDIIAYISEKLSGFNIIEHIKTALFGAAGSGGGAVGAAGGLLMKAADLFGQWNPIEDIKGWLDEKIGDWSITQWFKEKLGGGKKEGAALEASDLIKIDTAKLAEIETQLRSLDTTASTVATNVSTAFTNITNNARTNFVNMANIVRNQMLNCANIVRNQAVNMANIFRNQFVSMANVARNQMVNVSNIVRNQAVSWSNIIRNQVQNARNALTSSFLSMAAVARTQMVNISNIVRNQAVAWSNIIRNQAANARNALTSSFMSMAAVVRNQMANCASIVRSYMSQIRAAVSQQMTMNFKVNKTITTTNVTKNVTEGLRSTMGAIGRSTASLAAPQAVTIGGQIAGGSGIAGVSGGSSIELYVPLNIDGRRFAKATATYSEQELAKLSKRNTRRRGE